MGEINIHCFSAVQHLLICLIIVSFMMFSYHLKIGVYMLYLAIICYNIMLPESVMLVYN